MRIQLASDVHTEHYNEPVAFLTARVPIAPKVDVLLLAGDIVSVKQQSLEQVHATFSYFASRAKHVLYVPGNHEYYCGTRGFADGTLRSITSMFPNVTMLENQSVIIEKQQFFGGCMWFDANPDNHWYTIGENAWSDFKDIKDIRDWVYEENAAFKKAALEQVKPGCVVMTHMLPNNRSVARKHQSSNYNRFFVSDQTQVMFENGVRLWVHGHTHDSCDYVFGDTRVVCNPYGYHFAPNKRYKTVLLDV